MKESILKALKNAVHFRGLAADETVTVVVTSGGGGAQTVFSYQVDNTTGNPAMVQGKLQDLVSGNVRGHSVLTISAMKGDIDSFAEDKLTLEQFQEKVEVLREQLETVLQNWREQFTPGVAAPKPVKVEVEKAEPRKPAAKKPAAKKPAAKPAAKKTTAKKPAAKPAAKKTTTEK